MINRFSIILSLCAICFSYESIQLPLIPIYSNYELKFKENAPFTYVDSEKKAFLKVDLEYIKNYAGPKPKTRNIINLSKILIKDFKRKVPNTREDLETLPGVGRKTANVILSVAFNKSTIAVDTHIFRLSNRTKIALGKTPLDVEKGLEKVVPKLYKKHAHHWLILHGRYICKARNPMCYKCVVNDLCLFKNKNFNLKKNAAS